MDRGVVFGVALSMGTLLACGGPPSPAPREASRAHEPVARVVSGPARCPASVDVHALLARHAHAYGTAEAVAGSLPVAMKGVVALEGRQGTLEIVLAPHAYRAQSLIGGVLSAEGVDATGAWTLGGAVGVVERLSGVEAVSPVLEAWLLRRSYIAAFDAARDSAKCQDPREPKGAEGTRVDVKFARSELGSPVLSFDVESSALVSVSYVRADGSTSRTSYDAWSDADPAGVRWLRRRTGRPDGGGGASEEYAAVSHGLACMHIDGRGVVAPDNGVSCTEPPPDRFALRWPTGDRPRVRVPFTYVGNEIVLPAKLGGRDVLAFLDSGAGITCVDATTPAGAQFRSAMEVNGAGASQRVRLGLGELEAVDIADLHVDHVPTASVPIPALEAFGDKRPELILGYSFFASSVIRVDYKRRQLVFGRSTDGIFAKGAEPRAVPFQVLRGKIVVAGTVEGAAASFQVDTGNGGGLDLYESWASAHGLPGGRPVATVRRRSGAGTEETASSFYRLAKGSLGPIAFDGYLSDVGDPPDPGSVAGLAGNRVLARCDAVVFDVAKRTLWVEGACNGPVPESHIGWRFEKKADAAFAGRPWVIGSLWPGGAAERAGVRVGDRVLEVGGKPATIDVAPLWAADEAPVGTKVPIVLAREGEKARVRLVLELRSPLP